MRDNMVSATEPDWSREAKGLIEWVPSKSLLYSIRAYQRHANADGIFHSLARRLSVIRHRFWSVITGADIPINTILGGGLLIPHPNGIVIHPDVIVGPNCLIFQQVTIGTTRGGIPVIGGHVDIGAGARVLGPIKVGDNCVIGANSVLLEDLPPGSTAVGVPAKRIIRSNMP